MAEIAMTLYEQSKQLVANEPPMDFLLVNQKIEELANAFYKKKYLMFLCREKYDYSLVSINLNKEDKLSTKNNLKKELLELIQSRGQIVFIDEQNDGNYEIWIRDTRTLENSAYYLFDYSNIIIEVK